MCGIAGGTNISEDAVAAMLDRIRHRGPDGSGASNRIASMIASPIKFYNATLKSRFGYLPKD